MQDENKKPKSFHQGMKAELKKVIWPTGKQVVKSTFATIGFVLLISVILVALNFVFNFLNTKWYGLVLGNEEDNKQQNEQNVNSSGDLLSGDVVISGDEIISGENDVADTNVDSGEGNSITE